MSLKNILEKLTNPDKISLDKVKELIPINEIGKFNVKNDHTVEFTPLNPNPNKSQSIIEILGNDIILRMTHDTSREDIIYGESIIQMVHSVNVNTSATDVVTSSDKLEGYWENVIIEWANTQADRLGTEILVDQARWNGNTPLTEDATIEWEIGHTDPIDSQLYYIKVRHSYGRKLRGVVLWANTDQNREGTELNGSFYDSGGYETDAYIRWNQSLGTEILPERKSVYYIKLRFDIGDDSLDLIFHGKLFRKSIISPEGIGIDTFTLEIPPLNNITRTLAIFRDPSAINDDLASNVYAVIKLKRQSVFSQVDYLSPEEYKAETVLQDPEFVFVNLFPPERRKTSLQPDFLGFTWNNLQQALLGAFIGWGKTTQAAIDGEDYYIFLKLNDFVEKFEIMTINWVNQFYDGSGVDFTDALSGDGWDNAGSDAEIQWDETAGPWIVLDNIDTQTDVDNWTSSGAATNVSLWSRDLQITRFQTWLPSLGIMTTAGTSNGHVVSKDLSPTVDLTNHSHITFYAMSNHVSPSGSPTFRFRIRDSTPSTTTAFDIELPERNKWYYIQIALGLIDRDSIDRIEFEVVDSSKQPNLIIDRIFAVRSSAAGDAMPAPDMLYYMNVTYYDPSVSDTDIIVRQWKGQNEAYLKLVPRPHNKFGTSLIGDDFNVDPVSGVMTLGTPLNNTESSEHVLIEYIVDTADTRPVQVTIPAFTELETHLRINYDKQLNHALIEIFDLSELEYLETSTLTLIPLLGTTPNAGDFLYIGSEDRFENIMIILNTAADWLSSNDLIFEFYNGTSWDTFTPQSDETDNLTNTAGFLIKLGLNTTQWNSWSKTSPHLNSIPTSKPLYETSEGYWIRISSSVNTSTVPLAVDIRVNPYEQFWHVGFHEIEKIEIGTNKGRPHSNFKLISPASNTMKLFNISASQLDSIQRLLNDIQIGDMERATNRTLNNWGLDIGIGRLPDETDEDYLSRIKETRRLTAATVPDIENFLASLLELDPFLIEIIQWWNTGWVLNTRTQLVSQTLTVTQGITRNASGGLTDTVPPLIDPASELQLYNEPYIMRWIINRIGVEFNWINTLEAGFGYDLSEYKPRWDFSTKEVVWTTEPPEKHPADITNTIDLLPHSSTYYVNYTYFALLPTLPTGVVKGLNQGWLDFLNSIDGDELLIIDDKPPTPGWWALITVPESENGDGRSFLGLGIQSLAGVWANATNLEDESIFIPQHNNIVTAKKVKSSSFVAQLEVHYTFNVQQDMTDFTHISLFMRTDTNAGDLDIIFYEETAPSTYTSILTVTTSFIEENGVVFAERWLKRILKFNGSLLTNVDRIGFKFKGGINASEFYWLYNVNLEKFSELNLNTQVSIPFIIDNTRFLNLKMRVESDPESRHYLDNFEAGNDILGWTSSDPTNTVINIIQPEEYTSGVFVLQIDTTSGNSQNDRVYTSAFLTNKNIQNSFNYLVFDIMVDFNTAIDGDKLLRLQIVANGQTFEFPIPVDKPVQWENQRFRLDQLPDLAQQDIDQIAFRIIDDSAPMIILIDNMYLEQVDDIELEIRSDDNGSPSNEVLLTRVFDSSKFPMFINNLYDFIITSEDVNNPFVTVAFATGVQYHILFKTVKAKGLFFYHNALNEDGLSRQYYFLKGTRNELMGAFLDRATDGTFLTLTGPVSDRKAVNFFADVRFIYQ